MQRVVLFAWFALAWMGGILTGTAAVADEDVVVEVLRPAADDVVPRTFDVRGRIAGAADIAITINGTEVAPKDGAFSARITATKDGPFVVRVLCGRPGRPVTTIERFVDVDDTPPKLAILEPRDPIGDYPGPEAHVRGVVDDLHPAEVKVNGQSFPIAADGSFDAAFLLAKEGELTVEVVAVDRAGNTARAKRVLRRGTGTPAPTPPPQSGPRTIDTLFLLDRALPRGSDDPWALSTSVLLSAKLPFQSSDRVGVISFDQDAARVEAPLSPYRPPWSWVPTPAPRKANQGRLLPALDLARTELRESTAALRHLIVVLGGRPESGPELVAAVNALREAGIGVTVIAIGDGDGLSSLSTVARSGGGRYFSPNGESEVARTLAGEASILVSLRPPRSSAASMATSPYAETVVMFLARWAVPEGTEKDAATGFPKRIRRKRDSMSMVLIPAGAFQMGAVPGDRDPDAVNSLASGWCEGPRHAVTLSKAYYMDECEVTVGMWRKYASESGKAMPSLRPEAGETHPIHNVSWDDAQGFALWANATLPTEAQWERAARGGRDGTVFPWGLSDDVKRRNTRGREDGFEGLAPVKSFEPNLFGLFDMCGNVVEWCADWFDTGYYAKSPGRDPLGSDKSDGHPARVARGGSFRTAPVGIRISFRDLRAPESVEDILGFRCVRDLP